MDADLEKEKDIKDAEKCYRRLKLKLEELQNKKRKKIPLCMGAIVTSLSSIFCYIYMFDSYLYDNKGLPIVFSIFAGGSLGAFSALYTSMIFEMTENKVKRRMLDYEVENVQDKVEEDVFENSIKMSYKYLDQYYHQTREQAQKGFFVTVCISVFGAALIGAGIVAMFLGKTTPSYITCASGVITEFISAIFFYLYNKTITSMSKYHNKLVLSQNISIALKVADTLPDSDKTKAKNTIIDELLKDVNSYLTKSDIGNKKISMP